MSTQGGSVLRINGNDGNIVKVSSVNPLIQDVFINDLSDDDCLFHRF